MPTLTVEAIRENPWNVMTHSVPAKPTELLLELASLAAAYCRARESLLMVAARNGLYTPPGWEPGDDRHDVHEENEALCEDADNKLAEYRDLFIKIVGWPMRD